LRGSKARWESDKEPNERGVGDRKLKRTRHAWVRPFAKKKRELSRDRRTEERAFQIARFFYQKVRACLPWSKEGGGRDVGGKWSFGKAGPAKGEKGKCL